MKSKPCKNCPFRADTEPFPLGRDRRQQIADSLMSDAAFGCHETTTHDDDGRYKWTEKERPCVGAAKLIENELGYMSEIYISYLLFYFLFFVNKLLAIS